MLEVWLEDDVAALEVTMDNGLSLDLIEICLETENRVLYMSVNIVYVFYIVYIVYVIS